MFNISHSRPFTLIGGSIPHPSALTQQSEPKYKFTYSGNQTATNWSNEDSDPDVESLRPHGKFKLAYGYFSNTSNNIFKEPNGETIIYPGGTGQPAQVCLDSYGPSWLAGGNVGIGKIPSNGGSKLQ